MKKNLLSILILVLLLVNIALTTVMMVNVIGTNSKTSELVTSISTALNLELYQPGSAAAANVPLEDTESYDVGVGLMVPLKASTVVNSDGTTTTSPKQSYLVFDLSLQQNKKHEDYKSMGGEEKMTAARSMILDTVNQVIGSHTLEECQNNETFDSIREELLVEIQRLFGSDFIYKISITGIKFGDA